MMPHRWPAAPAAASPHCPRHLQDQQGHLLRTCCCALPAAQATRHECHSLCLAVIITSSRCQVCVAYAEHVPGAAVADTSAAGGAPRSWNQATGPLRSAAGAAGVAGVLPAPSGGALGASGPGGCRYRNAALLAPGGSCSCRNSSDYQKLWSPVAAMCSGHRI